MGDRQYWFQPEKPSASVYKDICRIVRDIFKRYKDVLHPASDPCEHGYIWLAGLPDMCDGVSIYVKSPPPFPCAWIPQNIPFYAAVCETLLVLAAKIPGFILGSAGFAAEYSHGVLLMAEIWGNAVKNIRESYGINYDAGYKDEGTHFRFYLNVNGHSVLGKVHYRFGSRFWADEDEGIAHVKLYPEPSADPPPVRRVRRVCAEY
jgi:hypothetical protein